LRGNINTKEEFFGGTFSSTPFILIWKTSKGLIMTLFGRVKIM